jgi:hypothetical protein
VDVTIVRITSEFSLLQGWDDVRAQFTGHPTIKPVVADLFPVAGSAWKDVLSKATFKAKGAELEEAHLLVQARRVQGEKDILQSVPQQKRDRAAAAAKGRVPAHKVAIPLVIKMEA